MPQLTLRLLADECNLLPSAIAVNYHLQSLFARREPWHEAPLLVSAWSPKSKLLLKELPPTIDAPSPRW
jgi:hypothetical protein